MRRSLPLAAVVLALAGCDKPQGGTPPVATAPVEAIADREQARVDLEKSRAEKDSLAAELTKAKQELALAKAGTAGSPDDVARLRAERDALAADVTRLKKALEATLAGSRGAKIAAEPPRAADPKDRETSSSDAARARAADDDLAKVVDDLRRKERDLLDKLAASAVESERLRTATGTLEKQVLDAQGRADAASAALRDRLGYAGRESIPAHRALPIAWNAAAGETLRWSWTIEAAPDDLAADVLEFTIVAPDGTKAYGARAGRGKTADTGSLAATAGGRWTAVWQNRDPEEPFTVRFTVALEATAAPRSPGGE